MNGHVTRIMAGERICPASRVAAEVLALIRPGEATAAEIALATGRKKRAVLYWFAAQDDGSPPCPCRRIGNGRGGSLLVADIGAVLAWLDARGMERDAGRTRGDAEAVDHGGAGDRESAAADGGPAAPERPEPGEGLFAAAVTSEVERLLDKERRLRGPVDWDARVAELTRQMAHLEEQRIRWKTEDGTGALERLAEASKKLSAELRQVDERRCEALRQDGLTIDAAQAARAARRIGETFVAALDAFAGEVGPALIGALGDCVAAEHRDRASRLAVVAARDLVDALRARVVEQMEREAMPSTTAKETPN